MAENTQSVLERTAADQWKVLPSGLTVLVRRLHRTAPPHWEASHCGGVLCCIKRGRFPYFCREAASLRFISVLHRASAHGPARE